MRVNYEGKWNAETDDQTLDLEIREASRVRYTVSFCRKDISGNTVQEETFQTGVHYADANGTVLWFIDKDIYGAHILNDNSIVFGELQVKGHHGQYKWCFGCKRVM